MNKIPSVFIRDETNHTYVTEEVNPLAQWVIDGFGTPTRKYDGTCCLLDDDGKWWARREIKPGKPTPADFRPVGTDDFTGKTMGWVPIGGVQFAKYHAEALDTFKGLQPFKPGTYELCGDRINGNPESLIGHVLIPHATAAVIDLPDRSHAAMRRVLLDLSQSHGWEGVVFHHPDGRMAKLKAKDLRPDDPALVDVARSIAGWPRDE